MGDSRPFDHTHGKPLVSIGMPVYNGEKYIRRALDSLLMQDYEDFELIISDNASDDETVKICEEYAKKDRRASLFENPQNMGMIYNLGRVLELAHGEFFMWAACDDYQDSNYISALLGEISGSDHFELSCPRVVKVTPDNTRKAIHGFPERDILKLDVMSRNRVLMASTQSAWVYGLFRTASLRPVYSKIAQTGLVWAADHLIILSFLLNQSITGTNRTTLYQTKTGLSAQLYKPKSARENVTFGVALLSQALKMLFASRLTPGQKLYLLPFLGLYLEMRVFHWRNSGLVQSSRRIAQRLRRGLRKVALP
jgi:glycosyltransferase involved in cell wall biosynthesis